MTLVMLYMLCNKPNLNESAILSLCKTKALAGKVVNFSVVPEAFPKLLYFYFASLLV
jgi:hypothetical protein